MAQVCEQVYNPRTDEYEEYCYDDGSNETDSFDSTGLDAGDVIPGGFDWGDAPGEGSNTVVDSSTGNITYKYDDGSTLTVDRNGNPVGNTESSDAKGNSAAFNRTLSWATRTLGPTAGKVLSNVMANPGASLLTAIAAAKAFGGSDKQGGYNKPVPKLDAVRQQIQYNDPNRRPGEAGRQYFTDPRFVAQENAESLAAAQAAAGAQAQGILGAYKPAAAPAANPYAGKMPINWNPTPATTTGATTAPTDTTTTPAGIAAIPTQEQLMDPNFKIGSIGMASGGIASGRYLQGETDGMADEIPTTIDGDQDAALSHGEFVIPADVVSHLGNGNSDAGAKKLYQMMDRIRQARTGTKKQGKEINPDSFMPGGLAASKYATGGQVQKFQAGGTTATSAGGVPLDTSKTSSLSPWAGDYVTNFLGQGAALANAPMQTYGGPLTAGPSDLQQQGFAGISETAAAGYKPTTYTSGTFDTAQANKYMNPYLQATLNPQLEELRRQSQINLQPSLAKLTQAGGYGGGRQAIMESEANRNLLQEQNKTVGQGYSNAFDKAMAQFNAEQNRGLDTQKASELSRQYSADYGLKSLSDLMKAGQTQRDITSEGIAADKKQFEEQQAYPFNMVEFQRKLVEGLPIGSTTTGVNQDAVSKMQSDVAGLASLYDKLANLKLG